MAKESYKPDPGLRKSPETDENIPNSNKEKKLIVVKKKENKLKSHEKPFDEQMYESFEEIRKDKNRGETDKE